MRLRMWLHFSKEACKKDLLILSETITKFLEYIIPRQCNSVNNYRWFNAHYTAAGLTVCEILSVS
jgi:hypothetical protein